MLTLLTPPKNTHPTQSCHPYYLGRAANAYINAAKGDPDAILKTLSPDFCYYAVRAPIGNPLSAAALYCKRNEEQTKAIYNNL